MERSDVPWMISVLIIIGMVALMIHQSPRANIPDCNDPATWGTVQGVQHCAIQP